MVVVACRVCLYVFCWVGLGFGLRFGCSSLILCLLVGCCLWCDGCYFDCMVNSVGHASLFLLLFLLFDYVVLVLEVFGVISFAVGLLG